MEALITANPDNEELVKLIWPLDEFKKNIFYRLIKKRQNHFMWSLHHQAGLTVLCISTWTMMKKLDLLRIIIVMIKVMIFLTVIIMKRTDIILWPFS